MRYRIQIDGSKSRLTKEKIYRVLKLVRRYKLFKGMVLVWEPIEYAQWGSVYKVVKTFTSIDEAKKWVKEDIIHHIPPVWETVEEVSSESFN